jgi:predicted site-specific integrase-resolvase
MEEMSKHGETGHAAMLADMDRKTARKYIRAGKLPSEMVAARTWRTREDPFAKDWEEIEARLAGTPECRWTSKTA